MMCAIDVKFLILAACGCARTSRIIVSIEKNRKKLKTIGKCEIREILEKFFPKILFLFYTNISKTARNKIFCFVINLTATFSLRKNRSGDRIEYSSEEILSKRIDRINGRLFR